MPGQGVKSMFSIGYGYAAWEMALVGNGIPYLSVRPREWQKEMVKDISPVMSGTLTKAGHPKVDTKATALLLAQQLFPDFDFRATARSKKPHDGIVDAMLLAEYCKRRNT